MSTAVVESSEVPPSKESKLSKSQKERQKRKDRKKKKQEKKQKGDQKEHKEETKTNGEHSDVKVEDSYASESESMDTSVDVEIEYVAADPFENLGVEDGEAFAELKEVLAQFNTRAKVKTEVKEEAETGEAEQQKQEEAPKEKLSKKKRKLQKRLPIAVLKQVVVRPDLVEIHDTCSADPFLLMHLKAYHNAVPVPRHWSQKRKYLQGKRGIEKPPFDLPDFIKKTGIMDARGSMLDKDAEKTMKQKSRERLNPTMNKIGIDYQILHDAFFKHQTKPKLATYGDLYYEGKEFEVEMKEKRPGVLSKELKEALGIPEGSPPPWLINMQRVGPPPSYKNLKIPGLNAPIPPGAEYGYHPGGWGRPPSDENGRPLYAEAWGQAEAPRPSQYFEVVHWGALPEQMEVSVEEEEQAGQEEVESEEEERVVDYPGTTPTTEEETSGIETPLSGIETPQNLEANLRKPRKIDEAGDKQLYQVLEQRDTAVGGALYGSSHTYVVPGQKKPGDVDIALDPSELSTLTEEALKKRYDKAVEETSETATETPVGGEEVGKKRKRSGKDEGKKSSKKFKDGFQF